IDSLEVTALLESFGISHPVATERYDAPNTFALAEAVLEVVRRNGAPVASRQSTVAELRPSTREAVRDYLQGAVALLPGVLLMAIITTCAYFGEWAQGQVLAMSLGLTVSMIPTNGFVYSVTRRGSLFIAAGNVGGARRFLRLSTTFAALCLV